MKLHKILPIIFLIIAMMISCSQETVINENISGEATTPDTKICVNIKTENSRTVRPEITKWEITVTNKSDANLKFSRTIDGKATSATFVNITDGEYEITVRGFNKDNKIILKNGSNSFYIKPNTVNVCEIIPEDNFAYDTNGNPYNGNLSIQISGLKDLFTEGETLLLTYTKLPETNNESDTTCNLIFSEEGKISSVISEIPVGSYKIEITHNDEAKTKTKVNLVKDPVVNIYDNTTTEINWEWNYDSDEINTDQELKGIKIPVWNKPVSNRDSPAESSAPAKNGYLSANALFAEPTWDEEESYNFEYERDDGSTISATVNKGELEFINCTYDEIGDLWVLSGTKSIISFYDENDEFYDQRFCYVLKNLSTGENYKFSCSDSLAQDFTVVTIEGKEYLFSISSSDNNPILYAELKEHETVEIPIDNALETNIDLTNITALYINSIDNTNYIYIANTSHDEGTTANIYTGTISTNENGTLTLNINTVQSTLSLGISDFTAGAIQNREFLNYAFMISDMYINGSKLYVTAGCVGYNYKSWYYDDSSNGDKYHSFGGLFEYDLNNNYNLLEAYGVYNGNNANSPFLINDPGKIGLADNIIQATSDDSPYFAGPRYIIPSGNDLLIVDSGFYGVYTTPNDYPPLTDCEKRNRIFTFNINNNNELSFNSITKVDDSISFDYDYLTSNQY